ncbi:hypothetical protein JCM8547_007367 [Rhodosporidiobolus lusitaniae]
MPDASCTVSERPPRAPSLVARSAAAVSSAWRLKGLIPTLAWTTVSYYLFGPPQSSWSLRLALFTALARFTSFSASKRRQITHSGKPLEEAEVVEIVREQREKLEGMLAGKEGGQPKGGAVWQVKMGVKRRSLGGVLGEVDGEEKGEREVKAEWTAHRSLLPSESCSPSSSLSDRIILYFHGGAYALLSLKTHRKFVLELSKECGARVLSVDYRLSPESKFPGALHDAVSSYFYLTQEVGIPAANILVGGDSAGGNLALALMLYLRDEKLPMVRGGILISPWVDMTASLRSWDENKDIDYLTASPLDPLSPPRLFLPVSQYTSLLPSPYVSPSLTASLTSLPPLLIQSGSAETLRDEHTLLALRASKAGVEVSHEVWKDGVHVFQMVMREGMGREGTRRVGQWVKGRRESEEGNSEEAMREVDEELRKAWNDRPEGEKVERPAKASKPVAFTFERVVERAPKIVLREKADEAARKAVKEVEGYEPSKGLTSVFYPRAASVGLAARLRGLVGL